MSQCSILKDPDTGNIVDVLAPNGQPSLLYRDALETFQTADAAVRAWAAAYTPEFMRYHGDWINEPTSVSLDENGEPVSRIVFLSAQQILNNPTYVELTRRRKGMMPKREAIDIINKLIKAIPGSKYKLMESGAEPGYARIVPLSSVIEYETFPTADEILRQKEKITPIMEYMIRKFPGATYKWIPASSLRQSEHYTDVKKINSYVKDNVIYLVEGRVSPEVALEEISHIFVEFMRQDKPALFKGLFDSIKNDPRYTAEYAAIYQMVAASDRVLPRDVQRIAQSEFLARNLAAALKSELEMNPQGRPLSPLGKLLQRFFEWLSKTLGMPRIDPKMTLQDIAAHINSGNIEMMVPTEPYLYYNADGAQEGMDFDPYDRDSTDAMDPAVKEEVKRKTALELNLERAKENLVKLDKVKAFIIKQSATPGKLNMIAVVDLLIENAKYQVDQLEKGRDTTSITKYKGSMDMESSESKASEMGANFGTFYHNLIEELQDSYIETGNNPTKLYTQEWFDSFLEKNKKLIQFKNVDKKLLYEIGFDISQALGAELLRGNVLLPEISLAVEDAHGNLILGRLDIMSLDSMGRITVMDLKTTKSPNALKSFTGATMFPINELHNSYTNQVGWKDGVSEYFADILSRSKMNNFHMQLALYAEMLEKIGIKVGAMNVLALAYRVQGKEEDQTVVESAFHIFEDASFYEFDIEGRVTRENGMIINEAARLAFRGPQVSGNEEVNEEDPKLNPFALVDPVVQQEMIQRLIKLAEEQIANIEKERSEIEKNEMMDKDSKNDLIRMLTKRKAGIVDISEKLKYMAADNSSENLALSRAVVIKGALDVFAGEITALSRKIEEDVDIPKTYKLGSEENRTAIATLQSYLESLESMGQYLTAFKDTIIATTLDNDSRKDAELKQYFERYFDDKINAIARQQQKMVTIGKSVTKAIIMETIGVKDFEKVFGDVKKVLGPKLAWIDRTIDKIKKGEAPADTATLKAKRWLSSIFKQETNPMTRLQLLEQERNKIARMMDVNTLTEATLDEYLDGILNDDNSAFYMGQTMGKVLDVVSLSDIIGSNADSEMIISAMFQYMRNMSESARVEALRWADTLGIDELKTAAIQSLGGLQQANKILTQQVEVVTEYDENGQPFVKKTYSQYVDPVLEEYYATHDKFKDGLNRYSKLIRDESIKKKTETDPQKLVLIDARIKELVKEQEALSLEWTKWRIENTETRVKPEVLMLMHGSGFSNTQITDLYNQIAQVISIAGGEEYLTEEQQEQIDNLEAEISRIRTEAMAADPQAAQRIDELMEFFEFDFNYTLWAKKRAAIESSGDRKALERWDVNNTNEVPTEEWNQAREAIFQQLSELYGDDPQMENIRKEMSQIKRKAKVRGVFNFNYLQDSDVERFTELQNQLDELLKKRKEEYPLSEEDRNIQQHLFNRLGNLQKDVLDPKYTAKRDQMKDDVRKAWSALKEAEKKFADSGNSRGMYDQLMEARRHYETKEQEFADFFNKHNKTKYPIGQDAIALRKNFKELPNKYLMLKVPKDPIYIEKFPNVKYRIKRLKSDAYNPNYQNSFVKDRMGGGMYPMPKGIRFNERTNEFEISSNAKFVNPSYRAIESNPIAKEFYKKWIIEQYLIKQKNASGQRLGFNFPFVQQLALENVMAKGMSGVAREYQEKLQEITYNTSELEKATNESGMSGRQKVIFKENHLVTAELTTTDGIGAIVNWNAGYYANRKMGMLGVEMSAVISFLKSTRDKVAAKDQKQESNKSKLSAINSIIDQVEYNRDKFVFGQIFEKRDGQSNAIFNRKTMRLMMGVASFARMAFDIPMQFGNLLSGNVQAYLSTSESRHATGENYRNAKKMMYTRFLPKMLADWGTVSGASFESKLFRFMNPLSKDLNRLYDANTVGKMRRLANRIFNVTDLSMSLQDKGEVEIGLTTMLMIMDNRRYEVFDTDDQGNIKLDDQGNKLIKKNADGSTVYVNAIDAFGLDESGSIAPKKNVNISEQDINSLKSTIMGEIYRFQGNYATYTKSKFGASIIGSLYEFYRKYLIPAVSVRFHLGGHEGVGSMYSWDTKEAYMGWYLALGRMYQYYGWGKATKTLLYDTLLPGLVKRKINADTGIDTSDFYRGRAAMAGREVLAALAFYMLYQTLRSMLYDGDEEDFTYAELSLMRSLVKVSNESRSMVPMFVIGKPGDYIDNFGSFTSAFREGKTLWDLGNNAFFWADYHVTGSDFAYERGFYQRATPRFEEGDAKVLKNLYDLTGISNIVDTFSPYEAAKTQLKQK
jgi:hypothetical protein